MTSNPILAEFQQSQAEFARANKPPTHNLTVIRDDQWHAILDRLSQLEARLLLLEHHARLPEPDSPAPHASRQGPT
jgi:hypothetical protein